MTLLQEVTYRSSHSRLQRGNGNKYGMYIIFFRENTRKLFFTWNYNNLQLIWKYDCRFGNHLAHHGYRWVLKLGWHFFLRTNPKMNHVGESYPVPHRKTLFDETVNKNKEIKSKFSESNLGTYVVFLYLLISVSELGWN